MAENNSEDELNELVSLNFKITEGERRVFKVWCAGKGITQVEAFKRGFKLLEKQDSEGRP